MRRETVAPQYGLYSHIKFQWKYREHALCSYFKESHSALVHSGERCRAIMTFY